MLNAFRHQSGSHTVHQTSIGRALECSTPSGIKAVLTPESVGGPDPKFYECSTPSGIKAVLTCGSGSETTGNTCAQRLPASKRFSRGHLTRRPTSRSTSAQRLPASKRFSRVLLPDSHRICLCSTPSGIKAVLTSNCGRLPIPPPGAQRLPASKRFSRLRTSPTNTRSDSAQRLPASKRFSRGAVGQRFARQDVLNAFRHQSGSHPASRTSTQVAIRQCSTPSGIKAVLTALSQDRTRTVPGCSTPSGIKAVLTDRPRPGLPAAARAQRLPASKRFSRHRWPYLRGRKPVLNAFRHQSGSHRHVGRG